MIADAGSLLRTGYKRNYPKRRRRRRIAVSFKAELAQWLEAHAQPKLQVAPVDC